MSKTKPVNRPFKYLLKPLTPDFSRPLPATTRTEKRIARVVVREIAKPEIATTAPVVSKAEAVTESLQVKLVRLGWQTDSGASLDWSYWNKAPRKVYYESSTKRTIEAQE
jgi:hypothetical protein